MTASTPAAVPAPGRAEAWAAEQGYDVSFRDVNGVRLHTVAAGDSDAPLVVLLHGFPECWYGWHRQLQPLADAGFRVLVPDQRGYNRSERPDSRRAYRIENLSRDVVALIEREGRTSAHVVGHDWGALVAWDLARRYPDSLARLGIVNVPHFSAFRRALLTNPRQLARSWYAFCFQLPRLPDWLARRNDFAVWHHLLREGTKPGTFSESDIERYRDAWRRQGAPTAMLDWYRALLRDSTQPERERVDAPTRIIWGENDPALLPELADASLDYCSDGQLDRFDDAGHFIQHEYPDRVARLLADHLSA